MTAMRERLIRLPEDLDDAVQARAIEDDRTIAATVRTALRHWLVCPHKVRVVSATDPLAGGPGIHLPHPPDAVDVDPDQIRPPG